MWTLCWIRMVWLNLAQFTLSTLILLRLRDFSTAIVSQTFSGWLFGRGSGRTTWSERFRRRSSCPIRVTGRRGSSGSAAFPITSASRCRKALFGRGSPWRSRSSKELFSVFKPFRDCSSHIGSPWRSRSSKELFSFFKPFRDCSAHIPTVDIVWRWVKLSVRISGHIIIALQYLSMNFVGFLVKQISGAFQRDISGFLLLSTSWFQRRYAWFSSHLLPLNAFRRNVADKTCALRGERPQRSSNFIFLLSRKTTWTARKIPSLEGRHEWEEYTSRLRDPDD